MTNPLNLKYAVGSWRFKDLNDPNKPFLVLLCRQDLLIVGLGHGSEGGFGTDHNVTQLVLNQLAATVCEEADSPSAAMEKAFLAAEQKLVHAFPTIDLDEF